MVAVGRIVLVLIVVFAASADLARWIGAAQLASFQIVFTNPDGTPCVQPCLFGVRPGETSVKDAFDLLRAHPFTRHFEPNIEGDIFRAGSWRVIIVWGLGIDRVSSIELVSNGSSAPEWASLGQVVSVLGPPEMVNVDETFIYSYCFAGHVVFVHRRRIPGEVNMNDSFESVEVSSPTPGAVPWQGFSSVVYKRAAM